MPQANMLYGCKPCKSDSEALTCKIHTICDRAGLHRNHYQAQAAQNGFLTISLSSCL